MYWRSCPANTKVFPFLPSSQICSWATRGILHPLQRVTLLLLYFTWTQQIVRICWATIPAILQWPGFPLDFAKAEKYAPFSMPSEFTLLSDWTPLDFVLCWSLLRTTPCVTSECCHWLGPDQSTWRESPVPPPCPGHWHGPPCAGLAASCESR